ncbi:PH domain-containing protein [Candidatus Nomurabacteria bacterium]|mgnify:CR=1 FL=1|nr:PH domain-containing protein [Candidatus Kaiserbacteria bacterium]MCB9815010.1 PH domain-containing protein [Candidatus Nomurabacteria bacterium]
MLFEKIQLEPGEEVLTVVRKHWFVIATELLGTFVMLLIPFIILFLIALFPSTILSADISLAHYTTMIAFGVAAWSIITLMAGFATWTTYYLDLWIITDRRIILVDQVSFFNRNVSIFRLERLQDIEFYVKGFIPTLLNFGTIRAQTAGAFESNFKTNGLPDPRGLQATIQKAMDRRLALLHNNPDLAE